MKTETRFMLKLGKKQKKGEEQYPVYKDQSKVVNTEVSPGETTIVIKKKTDGDQPKSKNHLSDVLENLPWGLIGKSDTGMGATSLELNTPRHSIIVEPIRVTASSKAYSTSKPPNHTVLYVGSPTGLHTKKITKATIQAYIKSPHVKHKKIVVVADSLYKVIETIGPRVYSDYFLLLDEADSYQLDSTYRRSMEECIDIYKRFDRRQRAMVSATLNLFSDPELADEHQTSIRYDEEEKRSIKVIQTDSKEILGVTYDYIKEILKKHQGDKVVIAYNSVTFCCSLAEKLIHDKVIPDTDIAVLCSKNSQDKAGKLFKELDSTDLPATVNFLTSAYFTGFDILEKYHLISVSSVINQVYTLSGNRLKQIAGRCRPGLLSETIIHDAKKADPTRDFKLSEKKLVKIAQTELDSIRCLKNHYNKNPLLKTVYEIVSDTIIKTLDNNRANYVKKDKQTGEYKVSYLTIDARIEVNKTRLELYQEIDKLATSLKAQGHAVKVIRKKSQTVVDTVNTTGTSKEEQAKKAIEYLRTRPFYTEIKLKLDVEPLSITEKAIYNTFLSFQAYIDNDNLIDEIEVASKSRDNRALQNLYMSIQYQILPKSHLLRRTVDHHFKDGETYTREQILGRMSIVFTEAGLPNKITSVKNAVMFLKLLKVAKRKPKIESYKIAGDNPRKLLVIKTLPESKDRVSFQIMWQSVTDSPLKQ